MPTALDVTQREELAAQVKSARTANDPAQAGPVVEALLTALESGALRVAEPNPDGSWTTNGWVKEGILLAFKTGTMREMTAGVLGWHDKLDLQTDWQAKGVRSVPIATARRGAYVAPGAILMPSYINIGAYVGTGTMVDTWATVGSCAQIGEDVHLSGGVGIGGVLEPPGAQPVIIEDGCFIGSRAIVVEGVHVEREAVLGANVVLTSSTRILDVTGDEVVEHVGRIPARSVVIPGVRQKTFPAGEYGVPCALIIGQRKESTDRKTSLESALRDNEVQV